MARCAVWCLGFGSYLLGLNTVGYELTGGASTPGNVGIVDSTSPKNIIGFGLCIIFIGAFPHCCGAATAVYYFVRCSALTIKLCCGIATCPVYCGIVTCPVSAAVP